jgi:integrase
MARRRGTVERRARGFYAKASVVDDAGVRHRPRTGPHPTARDAQRALDALLADIDRGTFVLADATPLADYLAGWLAVRTHALRPSTHAGYAAVFSRYVTPAIGQVPLKDLRPSHLNALYADMVARGLSARTVRTVHVPMRRALADAVREGILARNVADAATLPRTQHTEMATWDGDTLSAFLTFAHTHAPQETATALHVAATTGMRRGEVAGLRWDAVDLERATLRVTSTRTVVNRQVVTGEPKTSRSRRTVALDAGTVAALRRWKLAQPPSELVFTMHPDYLSATFETLQVAAGVMRIRLHDLRHTAASLMLGAGIPVHVVSARLGHVNPTTTWNVYSHVLPTQGIEAAEVMGSFAGTEPGTERAPGAGV